MRTTHLPDGQLTPDDVPGPDAPVSSLTRFAHRYHAYKVAGSLQRVAAIAVATHDEWVEHHDAAPDAVLDAPVARLRVALFHTARAYDHTARADDHTASADDRDAPTDDRDAQVHPSRQQGDDDDGDAATWIRVLVRSIAAGIESSRPR